MPKDLDSANALMDVYEEVSLIELAQQEAKAKWGYELHVEKRRSEQRQMFLAFLWELLDVDISQGVARWQSAA
jgi:hypothetical protein